MTHGTEAHETVTPKTVTSETVTSETVTSEAIRAAADRIAAAGDSSPRLARDPVNRPMIRNWLEAIAVPGGPDGADSDSSDQECPDTVPPAMIQVWTMPGLRGHRAADDPLATMIALLDEAGFTAIVATNCDQAYHRPLRLGERLAVRARLVDVTGPKRTALGEGWFVTTRSTWTAAGEPVATMDFRVLKFKPAARQPQSASAPHEPPQGGASPSASPGAITSSPATTAASESVMRPLISPDTAFFWAGTALGELRIQRCDGCGALRHPPGPRCAACGSMTAGHVVASGTGEVYSYVVHHHPPVPGKKLPLVIALVELSEGVRMVGELLGLAPDEVRIGLPVRSEFARVDDDLTLPAWRAVSAAVLPSVVIEVTPTFVISSALATRDFQDVHHDRDRAVAGGAKDIFLNILTTTGLVQRYVSRWAGPDAVFRAISIKLGVPCHAGDTLTLAGEVTADDGDERVIAVTGRCRLGAHVTATVRLDAPGRR